MRSLWFMPMTYLAGIHGFAYFVPYLAFVGAAALLIGYSRKLRKGLVPVPVPAFAPQSELEMAPA